MRTLKITLEYDGTDFVGWQIQPNGRSVQEELERALARLLQEEIRVTGGGRTDAGVHARGQVAHCTVRSAMPVEQVEVGLNALLPEDVVVHRVEVEKEDFHSRYHATRRRYRYVLRRSGTALDRKYCWVVRYPLNIQELRRCAGALLGIHDFRSFCKEDATRDHHRCEVFLAEWREEGERLEFLIEANRFLYGMVRALVGTMIDVGRGRITYDDFVKVLELQDRKAAGMSAPARGLFLESISYEGSS